MKARIYLDSCIFIAQHKADAPAQVMTCIQTLFSEIEAGKYYALTSSATLIEVLEESERVLDEVMDGRKGEFLDASLPVMSLARDIRKKIRIPVAGGKPRQLDLPDCIHIATAKLYDCECLITVDSKSMLVAQADIDRYFKVKLKQPCEVTDAQLVLQV